MKRLWLILPLLFIFSCEDKKDTTPPEVTITSPTNGSKVNEVVTVSCMSTDNKEVSKVELWVDGQSTGLIDETEPYSFQWNTTTYSDGDHTLIVRGYDTSDNQGDSPPITVKVDNTVSVPNSVSVKSVNFLNGGFSIDWSKSIDGDFKSYTLEHSVELQMNDYEEIFKTEDVNVTNTRMENTSPLTYHYFRVTVTDTFLYQTKGAIFTSKLDPIPDSVDVKSVTYDLDKMTVLWEKSKEGDFGSYKLLYSKTESGERDTLMTYTDNNTTSYSTSTYDPTHENWYWVIVSDTLGQSSIGNGMTNITDSPPTLSGLSPIMYENGSFIITWSKNNDNDFKSYTLYESSSKDMSGQIETLTTQNREALEFQDINISYDIQKFYRLVVSDMWGQNTQSSIQLGSSYQKIVFTKAPNQYQKLFVIDSGPYNEGPIQISDVRGEGPLWFPDGAKILFHYNNDESATIKPDGTDLIIHPDEVMQVQGYNISPDGNLITLWNNYRDIYKINHDGTNLTQLSPNDDYSYSHSDFSSDGSKIVFQKRVDLASNQTTYQVWTMDINGENLTRLSPESEINSSWPKPKWSPIRNEILFSKNTLWIMNSDGSNAYELSSLDLYDDSDNYQWSPDGNTILFTTENRYIYTIERDGSNLTQIGEGVYPSWSPDGLKIIFMGKKALNTYQNITIVNIDGSNPIIITEGELPKLQPRP